MQTRSEHRYYHFCVANQKANRKIVKDFENNFLCDLLELT